MPIKPSSMNFNTNKRRNLSVKFDPEPPIIYEIENTSSRSYPKRESSIDETYTIPRTNIERYLEYAVILMFIVISVLFVIFWFYDLINAARVANLFVIMLLSMILYVLIVKIIINILEKQLKSKDSKWYLRTYRILAAIVLLLVFIVKCSICFYPIVMPNKF